VRSRLLVIAVVATLLVALAYLAEGIPRHRHVVVTDPVTDGASVTPTAAGVGSTWFCPAGTAGTPTAPTHRILIANPTSSAVKGQIRTWSTKGVAQGTVPVAIAARTTLAVGSKELGGSVGSTLIELDRTGVTVNHELATGRLWDEGPCASQPAADSYFPSVDSRRGNSAQLTIFNPFQDDAVIDVTASTADSVRVPPQLSSVVVSGGTSRTFELGSIVQRRASFAASVRARSGRFVAELVQYAAGQASPEDESTSPTGLRMQLGAPSLMRHQLFADGLVTAGITESYVISNPTSDQTRVTLQVLPFDADPQARPEPFVLDVPPDRTATVQLDQENRVPPDTPHWVRLDVVDGRGVVAERLTTVTAANQFGLASGIASSMGSPVTASRWNAVGLEPSERTTDFLTIANPSVSRTAHVKVQAFGAGAAAAASTLDIDPGKGGAIDLRPIVAASPNGAVAGLVVTSDVGVVVERRAITSDKDDLAFIPASPLAGTVSAPPPLAASLQSKGS
jgi:hypothetical protein